MHLEKIRGLEFCFGSGGGTKEVCSSLPRPDVVDALHDMGVPDENKTGGLL